MEGAILMADRVILHCDCNSFYASVELLDHPELQAKPVAVAGSADNRHGIILAKNEAAKKCKVQTAETIWQARQKCPGLILLPPHHAKYQKYSRRINDIYAQYTDRVEPFGIDESWLDITGSWQLFGSSPRQVADKIREEVKAKTKLTISVGISFNKVFAKLGSDYKKPDATTEITQENYRDIVWPLPAASLLYVGRKAEETLKGLGIETIGQLAESGEELLVQVMGKLGRQLAQYARGEDNSPVAFIGQQEPVKSVGNGLTFRRNLIGRRDIRTAVGALADEVAVRLRWHKLYAQNVQVLIKNPELKSITRQKQLKYATNLAKDIVETAMQLLQDNWDFAKPIRMLTITAQNLTEDPFTTQTSLFGEETTQSEKREKLEKSMDAIRNKYGYSSIFEAGVLHNDIGVEDPSESKNEKEK